jgi:hypothetical protein
LENSFGVIRYNVRSETKEVVSLWYASDYGFESRQTPRDSNTRIRNGKRSEIYVTRDLFNDNEFRYSFFK